jgi:hypothetical protein
VSLRALLGPDRRIDGSERPRGGGEFGHACIDRQIGLIDAPQLLGTRKDMDQRLLRTRNLDQAVLAGGHLAQPRADDDQEIGAFHARGQLRIEADADIAGVAAMGIVKHILPTKRAADR